MGSTTRPVAPGVLLAGNEEIGRSADCESPDAVKDAAIESGFIADRIEVV